MKHHRITHFDDSQNHTKVWELSELAKPNSIYKSSFPLAEIENHALSHKQSI